MRIMGIDPGTATTGYGIVDIKKSSEPQVIEWGLIETEKNGDIEKRLNIIYKVASKLIKNIKPDIFVMEKVFFATNAKTVISVGQAQGVLLLAASKAKIKVIEYAPGTIKKTITGDGRAKKKDIQKSLRKMLGNHVRSKKHQKTHFDDAADAIAVALTHAILSINRK